MFRDDVADILQQIAIFVEAIGLTLVIVEVWFPGRARRFEDWLDAIAREDDDNTPIFNRIRLSLGCVAFLGLVGFGIFHWLALDVPGFEPDSWLSLRSWIAEAEPFFESLVAVYSSPDVWISLALASAAYGTLLLVLTLPEIVSTLDTWADGKAVGALGVIIATVGFSFECYQVMVLWLKCQS